MLAPHMAAAAPLPLYRTRSSRSELVEVGNRSWSAIAVQVQELKGCSRFSRPFKADAPKLLVMLEEVGGSAEVRPCPERSSHSAYRGKDHISFVPTGMDVWMSAQNVRYLRQVVISFHDGDSLSSDPRLMFADRRVWGLASLLASEVLSETPLDPAYGDGLGTAILTSLSAATDGEHMRSGLTPWQVKRVTEYVRQNTFAKIHLSDMAAVLGVSQSHFSRAFKISTGVPPHRWLLDFRVAESKRLLLDTSMSLAEIAIAIGFSEQGHFTRAFGAVTGTTPAAWRKSLKH
jgi:AraC family transcriptional regulator